MISKGLIGLTNVILPGRGLKQGPFVSEQELLGIVEAAAEDEVIEFEERRLIESIIEFGDTVAREVMVLRPDMVVIPHDATVSSALDIAIEHASSRLPVMGEGEDEVVGLGHAKDLMRAERDGRGDERAASRARPVRFIPENKPLNRLMREMQADKFHLAILLDEYGDIAGMVTLEDCLEEASSEIVDEFDCEEDREVVHLRTGPTWSTGDEHRRPQRPPWRSNCPTRTGTPSRVRLQHPRPCPCRGEAVEAGLGFAAEGLDGHRIRRVRVSVVPGRHGGGTCGVTAARLKARPQRRRRGRCSGRRRGHRLNARGSMRSGFVTLAGRPNVGKSTLLSALVGQKVSIVSDKPQTTRTRVRAVVNRPDVQLVFVDTPGIHKPVTALGERLNATAVEALDDIDVYGLVLDATALRAGDRFVAARLPADRTVVVVNKIDLATHEQVLSQLGSAAELEASAYFPISSVTGEGVPELLDHLSDRMPEGPAYFPPEVVSDVPEAEWVAELVREQLLAATRDELPCSIATRVTEWEWPAPRWRSSWSAGQKRHGHRQGRFRAEGRRFGGQDGDAGGAFLETRDSGQGLAAASRPNHPSGLLTRHRSSHRNRLRMEPS